MQRVKNFCSKLMLLGAGVLLFTACNDDDPAPVIFDGSADVFVQKVKVGELEKYAPVFYVYANKSMASVTVTAPGEEEKTYELVKFGNNDMNFRYLPVEADFTDVMLAAGKYTFELKSKDEADQPLKLTDDLEEGTLGILEGVASVFEEEKMKTTWTALEGAEAYVVKLYNAEGELIFLSETIKGDATGFNFDASTKGWLNSGSVAQDGKTYALELSAFMFEEDVKNEAKGFNIQFQSINKQEVVWGATEPEV